MSERITDAEFRVMEVLWAKAPLAASDVAKRLAKTTGWSAPTVKTLLARLVDKEAIATEADGRRFLYRPLISRETHARAAAASIVERLFGGRTAPLVAHLADAGALSAEDIAELEALIEELKHDRR